MTRPIGRGRRAMIRLLIGREAVCAMYIQGWRDGQRHLAEAIDREFITSRLREGETCLVWLEKRAGRRPVDGYVTDGVTSEPA
jgi:hypothetical protein